MDFQAYVFDLDGTVYLGDTLLPGAKETIAAIRKRGKKVLFLSNNPLSTRQDYFKKLTGLGIQLSLAEIITSSVVLCRHLRQSASGAAVYPIGEEALRLELEQNGFSFSTKPEEIQYVIASFDRTFTYEKLVVSLRAINRGAHFIATHPDRTCPFAEGELPDAGAVIGAIEGMTGKKVEWVAGKPSQIMAAAIGEYLALEPAKILLVGDRLQTDIAMGRWGFKTALTLSGVSKEADLKTSPWQPDFVFPELWGLNRLLEEAS